MGKEARLHRQRRERGLETYRGTAPNTLAVVEISREYVQAGSTGSAVAFLKDFVRRHGLICLLRDGLSQYRGSQGFLGFVFSGYDTDRREIWEIPEVRRFVRALLNDFPFFPFLLVDQAEVVRGEGSPILESGANLFFLTGLEPEQPISGRGGVMISNRGFLDSLRIMAQTAIHQATKFCGDEPGLAEILPGLINAKCWRLFSQATGIPVRKCEKVEFFVPAYA